MSKVLPGAPLDPPPPDDVRWLKILSARIPEKARDGRPWAEAYGSLPDPYAVLLLNGKEILRTPTQSKTLEPTWSEGPRGNFRITPDDKLRVELWGASALNDQPIGMRDIGSATGDGDGKLRVALEGGSEVIIALEPGHATLGLGIWFELRSSSVYITRLLVDSPADRAGIERGDQVLEIGGRPAKDMSADEVRSAFNAVTSAGLPLLLKHADGTSLTVTVQDGPIYATYDQVGPVD